MVIVNMKNNFINLPKLENSRKNPIKYPLIKEFSSANIIWDSKRKSFFYNIVEPELNKNEKQTLEKIKDFLKKDFKKSNKKNKYDETLFLVEKIKKLSAKKELKIDENSFAKILYYILRDFIGLNEVESLMHDPYIINFGVNKLEEPVFVTHKKYGVLKTNIIYKDLNYLNNFVIKLANKCKESVFYVTMFDGKLPDGATVEGNIKHESLKKEPGFIIRKFKMYPFSPIDILNFKTASSNILAYLWFLIDYSKSILISGKKKTGKTTMLNTISMFIHPNSKIISIEDLREINLPHEKWLPETLEKGSILKQTNSHKLLKKSFKKNPDYIIMGEIKGKEAFPLFHGIASGTPIISTIEAIDIDFALKKLETKIELPKSLIDHLDVVILMDNNEGDKIIKEVLETKTKNKVFSYIKTKNQFKANLLNSELLKKIGAENGMSYRSVLENIENRKKILEWMQKFNIVQYDDFFKVLNFYHENKNKIMNFVEKNKNPNI